MIPKNLEKEIKKIIKCCTAELETEVSALRGIATSLTQPLPASGVIVDTGKVDEAGNTIYLTTVTVDLNVVSSPISIYAGADAQAITSVISNYTSGGIISANVGSGDFNGLINITALGNVELAWSSPHVAGDAATFYVEFSALT